MKAENLKQLYDNFSIIPLDGKIPIWKDWVARFSKKKTEFDSIKTHDGNFGIVCGFEGLEVIDIDNHFGNADALLAWIKDNFSLSGLLLIQTGGGGYHIYYKCDTPLGNQVLAKRKFVGTCEDGVLPDGRPVKLRQNNNEWSTNVTMVETRGTGGQVVFYDNIIKGSIDSIKKITDEERNQLFEICIALNEVAEKKPTQTKERVQVDGVLPGDLYNNDTSAIEETFKLLLEAGWTTINNTYWWRPGKTIKEGPSATFGKVGVNRFYNFSSNGHPFEQKISNSMMGVRAILKHNGDFKACAKELAQQYDIKPAEPVERPKSNNKWKVLEDIIKDWKLKFRYNQLTTIIDVSRNSGQFEKLGLLPGDIIKEMETKRGIKSISASKVHEMIENTDICRVYNPIIDFFNSLPKWDNVDHFDKLKKYITLDTEEDESFFFSMLKKQMIRATRCALVRKYINRMVFVLHGPQEIGKSEFFRWLLPADDLYNEEMINPGEKDSILALSRYVMINMDDLDSLNKKEVHKVKAFVSHGKITKRVAYGRHDEDYARIASLFGSTNRSDILADEKNTRWLILKVIDFDWKGYLKDINPLQLWAQALYELKGNKEAGELTRAEKFERDRRNESEFLEISPEREILQRFFEKGNYPITATEIKHLIEVKKHPLKMNIYQLTKELKRLFGEPSKPTRENGKTGRYYYVNTDFFTQSPSIGEYEEAEIGETVPF